jgi:hypothetical protein
MSWNERNGGASALTCAEVRELAPELALGILGGAERAEVVMHVNGCARCQAHVAELTEAADMIPQLVPEAEPPPGFESRVLRRLGDGDRRSRRRWIATVASVAAAAIIVSITIVRVIESRDATSTHPKQAPVAVAMTGGAGNAPAGWAYVNGGHGVAVAVDYGVPSGAYTVMVGATDAPSQPIGTVHVDDGHGSWTGRSTSRLLPGTRIALVDATGTEVCHGTVPVPG